ncbi:hypothetical protein J4E83_005924 [Alternaria metachromatica]|uniref:uncharacterized protein n=1 Tax=Alternaria metachromatica TaxID=283354 RepID=UPI0020C1F028|nr:uncharacterized protein J4E83_005924 [Alternaria metachromatica]KAI4618973.1 hypothetical protein J4E83_005924 [Alternaria metachromatica]
MSDQDSAPPTSPFIPNEPEEKIAMASRHDSMFSEQGLEVAELRARVAELEGSSALATNMRNEVSHELQFYKNEVAKKKDEIYDMTSASNKQSRDFKALEVKMAKLREDSEQKLREMEKEVVRGKTTKKRTKEDQEATHVIAQLQTELGAKDSRIDQLEARLSNLKPPENAYREAQTPLANCRPTDLHHEHGCVEHQKLISQELLDAHELLAAAEAEAEGFRHLAKANADLTDGQATDLECIRELRDENERRHNEINHLKEVIGSLRAEQHFASSEFHDIDLDDTATQSLSFGPLTNICITPIAPEDNKVELRALELEVEGLTSENHSISLECTELESKLVSVISTLKALDQEQETRNKCTLTLSDLQNVSTSPRTPIVANKSVINPDMLAGLDDLGKSINNLSDPPFKMTTSAANTQATPDLPNVALTINIKPSNKRNYSLFQRVKSAMSSTSKVDIKGPKEIANQFVALMEDVEKDHAEKTRRVVALDKAVHQYRAHAEALEAQIRNQAKCLDPAHRTLADELAAKNEQFAMQEQLLATFRHSNVA